MKSLEGNDEVAGLSIKRGIEQPTVSTNERRRPIQLAPYVFAGGAAVYLLAFLAIPLVRGVWLSFTDTRLLNPTGGNFIGTENYRNLLAQESFYDSLLTTLLYSGATVLGALTLGTISALGINDRFRGRTVARAILTLPWAVPGIAAAMIFAWIYNVDSGILNEGLRGLGIGQQGWLTDPDWGLFSVTLASVWKVFPFVMLVMLAALQSVPSEIREAARVDGADRLNVFRAAVWPHIAPTLRVVALLMTIWSFRRFEIIYLLTGGGPVDRTNTIVINVYRQAFHNSELGVAAALAMLGLGLSLVITTLYFVSERRVERKASR